MSPSIGRDVCSARFLSSLLALSFLQCSRILCAGALMRLMSYKFGIKHFSTDRDHFFVFDKIDCFGAYFGIKFRMKRVLYGWKNYENMLKSNILVINDIYNFRVLFDLFRVTLIHFHLIHQKFRYSIKIVKVFRSYKSYFEKLKHN